ncbi:MAG: glycosyltransferase [Lachnospiraceae bacterium]|nr:glycosyltransferase [Lachnospiraceae bacterium]
MNAPFFTVVTTCFNSSSTIHDTLDSVLNQTFQDYEYIIYDAGSTDGTVDILNLYKDTFNGRMRYVSEPDRGIYDGMNKGVRDAKGYYVSILNSDDYYHSRTLERVHDISKSCSIEKFPIVFGDVCRVKQNKEPIYRYRFNQLRIDNNIPFGHPSMFLPRSIYEAEGNYDLDRYKLAADMDFQYRLYQKKEHFEWIVSNHIFTYMREGGATDSLKNLKEWVEEIADLEERYMGKNKTVAKTRTIIGRLGRNVKNHLPYSIQKKLYGAYRSER